MRMRPVVILLVVLLAVAGCSGDPDPVATSAAPSSAAPAPTPTPDVVVDGADAALTAAVAEVYAGQTGIRAEATLGTWKKETVAVVTSGDDVTLAVGPKWRVVGGWWPSLDTPASLGKGPRFVLVIGSDARRQDLKGTRGDTLQVLGIDGRAAAASSACPATSTAPCRAGGGEDQRRLRLRRWAAQVETVRKVTGLPIEGYVVTGFGGFRRSSTSPVGCP